MEVPITEQALPILPAQRQRPGLHAGFWLRTAAWLIDALILGPLVAVAVALVAWPTAAPAIGLAPRYAFEAWLWLWPASFAVPWLYYAVCESAPWQATPGKLVLGLRVTDACGRRIGFARASARWLGMLVSWATAGAGCALAGWTARKQALHDLMVGCCVVRGEALDRWRRAEPAPAAAPVSSTAAGMPGWALALLVLGLAVFLVLPLAAVGSAVAVATYHARRARAEVAAGLDATVRIRALVGEYILQRGRLPIDNRTLGLPAPDAVHGPYVRSVRVADGKLVITYGNQANVRVRGGHLVASPVGDAARLRWRCSSPDIATRYLPQQCRE